MKNFEKTLKSNPIAYVTRDIERALGLNPETPGYFIISNYNDFAKQISEGLNNILLIKEDKILATWELLEHPQVIEFMNRSQAAVVVFKNTAKIEKTCDEQGWNLLNPKAELASEVEEKISQFKWLQKNNLDKYLPKTEVKLCSKIKWEGKPFILQFNRAHTGTGTILIEGEDQLKKIKEKFPKREARISEFVDGPSFTNNNVATTDKILLGNINYQITGLEPFTNNPFSTVGNDWGVVNKILSEDQIKKFNQIAREIGEKMKAEDWIGLYGVDINFDKSGKAYLIEINARQPASTTYESQLQKTNTTFEAHLLSLLKIDFAEELTQIEDGAQIIFRNTEGKSLDKDIKDKAEKTNFKTISYNNDKPGSDLLRIQSKKSIMKNHGEFNKVGQKIISL